MSWYNPGSWEFPLPGQSTSGTIADHFRNQFGSVAGTPESRAQAGANLQTAGGFLGSILGGQIPSRPASAGGYGQLAGGGGDSYVSPTRAALGASRLGTQLMNANQGLFAEIEKQKAGLNWAAALDTQRRGLQEQALRGDIASRKAAQALQNEGIDIRRNRLGMEPGFIEREYGLDIRSADIAEGRARDRYETDLRNIYSDAASRGNVVSTGFRAGRHDIAKQLWRDVMDVGVSKDRAGLSRERSLADTNQARALLDAEAKKAGLDTADLERQLNQGLAEIGLQGQIDAMDLATALNSADIKKVQAATEITQLLNALSPEQLQQFAPTGNVRPAQTSFGGRGMQLR